MNSLLDLQPKQWNLLVSPPRTKLLIGIAYLSHNTELTVLDCGRQFDSSIVARAARGRQEEIDRIKVQRAFICYEVVKLLERTPAGKHPILVLDFLSTFYDENVRMYTRNYLLESSIRHFQRLSQGAGLAVTVQALSLHDELYQRLWRSASHISVYETQSSKTKQLTFF